MIKNVRMMSLLVLIVFTFFPILQVAHVASAENHPPADGHVHPPPPPPPPPPRNAGDVVSDIAKLVAGSVATGIGAATTLAGVGLSVGIVTAPKGLAVAIGGAAIVGVAGPPTHSSGRNLWNDIIGLFDGDDD